jgi:hypothetical protein
VETFPTLSRYPNNNFKETLAYDPSIKSQAEDGTIISRPRFTTTKKQWGDINYDFLTANDKELLEEFQTAVMVGGDVFTWVHPKTNVSYTVRLSAPINFTMDSENSDLWTVSFSLIEA